MRTSTMSTWALLLSVIPSAAVLGFCGGSALCVGAARRLDTSRVKPLRGGGHKIVAQGENSEWGKAPPKNIGRRKLDKPLRCIVTGGSSGIGEAICRELGKRGAKVFVLGRNEDNLKRVAAEVVEEGGYSRWGVGDVENEDDVQRLYEEAEVFFAEGITRDSFGADEWLEGEPGVDLLVTSAGIGRFGAIEDMSEADFTSSFDVNVKGVWLWARKVLPAMKRQGKGQVVFISSVAGLRKFARCSVYGATKWAVQGIAGSLREECRGTGVKIATLCPGSVASPWWLQPERGGKEEAASQEMLEKMLTVHDCAHACMSIIDQAKSCDIETIVLEPPTPVAVPVNPPTPTTTSPAAAEKQK